MLRAYTLGQGVDEMAQFICDQRALGVSDDQIRAQLSAEHNALDIVAAFARANGICAPATAGPSRFVRSIYDTAERIRTSVPAVTTPPPPSTGSNRKTIYIAAGIGVGVFILGGIAYALTRRG